MKPRMKPYERRIEGGGRVKRAMDGVISLERLPDPKHQLPLAPPIR